jgi:hypothetical protein
MHHGCGDLFQGKKDEWGQWRVYGTVFFFVVVDCLDAEGLKKRLLTKNNFKNFKYLKIYFHV